MSLTTFGKAKNKLKTEVYEKIITLLMVLLTLCACGQNKEGNTTADLPYAKAGDVIAAFSEEESLYRVFVDDTLYVVANKEGRWYQLSGKVSNEKQSAIDALDVMADDYDVKMNELLNDISFDSALDFTDMIVPQSEHDSYKGKTVKEMIDAGFEESGWFATSGLASYELSKDLFRYKADITLPGPFDENKEYTYEDFYTALINSVSFVEPEYAAMPLK